MRRWLFHWLVLPLARACGARAYCDLYCPRCWGPTAWHSKHCRCCECRPEIAPCFQCDRCRDPSQNEWLGEDERAEVALLGGPAEFDVAAG